MTYLAKYSNSPMRKVNTSFADTRLDDFMASYPEWASKIESVTSSNVQECPMGEAVWFYWHNHLVRSAEGKFGRYETLPEHTGEAVNRYFVEGNLRVLRMVYYMVLITIREARHCKRQKYQYTDIRDKYEPQYDTLLSKIIGSGGSSVMNFLTENQDIPSNIEMGTLFTFLHEIFSVTALWNGGYGGKAWAKVTYPLTMLFNGKISPEVVMDTAFTLAHNNGPIFNKGLLYKHYDSAMIIQILDAQNSGQIPQYTRYNMQANSDVYSYNVQVAPELGGIYEKQIDWHLVHSAGAKGSYGHLASGPAPSGDATPAQEFQVPLPQVETWKLYTGNEYVILERGNL